MEAAVYAASVVAVWLWECRVRFVSGAGSTADSATSRDGSGASCEMDSSVLIAERITAEVFCTASRLSWGIRSKANAIPV
jgi:hypothetical protein